VVEVATQLHKNTSAVGAVPKREPVGKALRHEAIGGMILSSFGSA